jgi:hypothetical protein
VAQPELLSPEWWLSKLYKALVKQQEQFEYFDAYYRGEPKRLPWLPEQAHRDLQRLIALTRSNYMGLVIDSMVERMQIDGFRINGAADADKPTWDIWQENAMDSGSDQIILESAIGGKAFALVAPNPARPERPLIVPEHPTQAIVAYESGTGRRKRVAALKVWQDDWTMQFMATLHLPGLLFKYQADKPQVQGSMVGWEPRWVPREVRGETWPMKTVNDEILLIEVTNNPRLLTGGVSEIADVITVQDRVNKTLADRLMTQDYGAFPQKWATGFPGEDEDGNPQRIDVGKDRMVTSDIAETKFGQWDSAPLDPYSAAKREDIKDIASRTRTPAQYLLGEMSNVNGETLKASESGLVSKVRQRQRTTGEGFEDVVRMARLLGGLGGQDQSMETIWRNPEFRTEGELVDALVKMSTLNVPDEALWERWGASPLEIERWKKQREEQLQLDPIGQISRMTEQQSGLGSQGFDNQGLKNSGPGNVNGA